MDNRSAKEYFETAEKRYAATDYFGAIERLDAIESAFPNQKNVLFARARCFAALGRIDEARDLCIQCIAQWEAPRAQRLLDRLDDLDLSEPRISDIDPELNFERSSAYAVPEVRPMRPWHRISFIVIALIGAASIAGAFGYSIYLSKPAGNSGAYTQAEVQRERVLRQQDRLERLEAFSEKPGQIVPEEFWRLTAVNDLPDWQPGVYDAVPCPGALYMTATGEIQPRTISVYIPMAYRERPGELFPVVAISSAGRRTLDFFELEDWAEKNDAILVAIDTSSNRHYNGNWQAQDVAIGIVATSMRVDTRMGIAIGMSGGAATSWEMICRYPDNFVGLVMMGFGTSHNDCWIAPHVRVAYIHGSQEPNNWDIERAIPKLKAAGNPVRNQVVSGKHVKGPLAVRERMLTWILDEARRDLGTMEVSDAPQAYIR